ncbi:hypothetical protein [Bacillus cereus]|uniref:hypothetical protein n=1 Tax=Bacillus cereus TaxID=1396 RepID=UPI000953281B
MYQGVPVWGATQVAHITDKGVLTVLSGAIAFHLGSGASALQQQISSQQAMEVVNQHLYSPTQYVTPPTSELVIYTKGHL